MGNLNSIRNFINIFFRLDSDFHFLWMDIHNLWCLQYRWFLSKISIFLSQYSCEHQHDENEYVELRFAQMNAECFISIFSSLIYAVYSLNVLKSFWRGCDARHEKEIWLRAEASTKVSLETWRRIKLSSLKDNNICVDIKTGVRFEKLK